MIYYCSECEVYFNEDSMIKDEHGEGVHFECGTNDYVELTQTEIIDALNNRELA